MKKLFTNMFNLIAALIGMAWSVFMFFFNLWANSDTPNFSQEDDDPAFSTDGKYANDPMNVWYNED